MKKTYQMPSVLTVQTELQSMVCQSGGVTSDKGISYGGVDEEGKQEPGVRRRQDAWEDDEDTEEQ